jgi:hypothetical protein
LSLPSSIIVGLFVLVFVPPTILIIDNTKGNIRLSEYTPLNKKKIAIAVHDIQN